MDVWAKAERARTGRPPTTEEIARAGVVQQADWRPCVPPVKHQWRGISNSDLVRCLHFACRILGRQTPQGMQVALCTQCKGPTCTSSGRCPKCGGVFPIGIR